MGILGEGAYGMVSRAKMAYNMYMHVPMPLQPKFMAWINMFGLTMGM